jgi:hypothetical protein
MTGSVSVMAAGTVQYCRRPTLVRNEPPDFDRHWRRGEQVMRTGRAHRPGRKPGAVRII